MCLSHVWYNFFGYCLLYGNWVLDGCDNYIICTTNWFIQIPLEIRKWLVYKDFISKDTKLLSQLPWPSRKQPKSFISSNSSLVFLTCSILSANIDPLVCVVFFERSWTNAFWTFPARASFLQVLALCPLPCVFDWSQLLVARYQALFHSWQYLFHPLNQYLNSVYRQCTCW